MGSPGPASNEGVSSPIVLTEEDEFRISLAASKLALAMEASRKISQNQTVEDDEVEDVRNNREEIMSEVLSRQELLDREQEYMEYKAREDKLNSEYVSEVDTDSVLRDLVARKVEMQNTSLDLDTSGKVRVIEGEVERLSAEFGVSKASSSRRSQMRELRKTQLAELTAKTAEKMKELEERSTRLKLADEQREAAFRARMAKRVEDGGVGTLTAAAGYSCSSGAEAGAEAGAGAGAGVGVVGVGVVDRGSISPTNTRVQVQVQVQDHGK